MKKKIFTLLTLLLCAIGTTWATGETFTYTLNGGKATSNPAGYFSYDTSGKFSFNAKFTGAEYDGVSYSNGLKMEGTTKILFTSTLKSDVIIVQSTWSDKTIKFDGEELAVADAAAATGCRVYTISDVAAGEHNITRGSGESGLFLVKVTYTEESTSPELTVAPKTLSFALTPNSQSKNATFTLTGKNLTDGTYNLTVPSVDGLSVSPASFTVSEGAVNQEFTVTYASTVDVAEATAVVTAAVGELSANVTVTYSSRASLYTQKTVSEERTWNWEKLTSTVELSGETTPTNAEEFLFANIEDQIGFNSDFSVELAKEIVMINTQYPSRNKKFQNGTIKFTTTVPGVITVDFSDTGSSGDGVERYLNVNGVNTAYYTKRDGSSDRKKTAEIFVPAGDVVITGCNAEGGSIAICIYAITFKPVTSTTIAVSEALYRTFASKYPTDWSSVSGIKAYTASVAAGKVTFKEVTGAVPASEGLLIKAEEAKTYTIPVAATTPEAVDNALVGVTAATEVGAGSFVLMATPAIGFYKTSAASFTVGANTAYLPASVSAARFIAIDDEATGISEVKTAKVQDAIYTLGGQRVEKAVKGLYIQNGKKVIK